MHSLYTSTIKKSLDTVTFNHVTMQMVGLVGIEPTRSRVKVGCSTLSYRPAKGERPAMRIWSSHRI